MLDLVLRLAGAQRFGQIVPELEEPRVEHHQDAADVARAVAVEVERALRGVEVLRVGPVAFAIEEFHRHQRVEEIADPARMQTELAAELRAGQAPVAQVGEKAELDGGEKNLGRPESDSGLQDVIGRERRVVIGHESNLSKPMVSTEEQPAWETGLRLAAAPASGTVTASQLAWEWTRLAGF